MSNFDTGGKAFPCDSRESSAFAGMELRDWFAGMAMQAMVSCYRHTRIHDKDETIDRSHIGSVARDLLIDRNSITNECDGANEVACDAYTIADALIAEKRRTESK